MYSCFSNFCYTSSNRVSFTWYQLKYYYLQKILSWGSYQTSQSLKYYIIVCIYIPMAIPATSFCTAVIFLRENKGFYYSLNYIIGFNSKWLATLSYITAALGRVSKMRAELSSVNHCAVPFLSCAGANSCWYHYSTSAFYSRAHKLFGHSRVFYSYDYDLRKMNYIFKWLYFKEIER